MIVAAAGSASATRPPRAAAVAALPLTEWVEVAAIARPARLDRAIWLKAPSSPISEAAGAAAKLAGSAWARFLIPGAASVQPCGTDMLPTKDALPIDPVTGAPPTAELSMDRTALGPLVSGANAPEMNFGPPKRAWAACPFWAQA